MRAKISLFYKNLNNLHICDLFSKYLSEIKRKIIKYKINLFIINDVKNKKNIISSNYFIISFFYIKKPSNIRLKNQFLEIVWNQWLIFKLLRSSNWTKRKNLENQWTLLSSPKISRNRKRRNYKKFGYSWWNIPTRKKKN